MNVAVCRNRCFVAIKIHQRKIPFLKLLVLITNVQADGVGQQTGAVVCGAQAQADHDLVGIEIIDLRIASGLEGGFLVRHAATYGEVLVERVLGADSGNQHVVELNPAARWHRLLILDCVGRKLVSPALTSSAAPRCHRSASFRPCTGHQHQRFPAGRNQWSRPPDSGRDPVWSG